jgi:transcriptional regulator with XRE-family HTH domain
MSKKPTQATPKTFAANHRAAMESQDLTQEALARTLDVSLASVSRWVRGISEPSLSTLRRLAAELDTTADDLIRE